MRDFLLASFTALTVFAIPSSAFSASVVVNADEWALSDNGFVSGDAEQFVTNLVDEFGTSIHAYSTNFAYSGASLAQAMSDAGATYTWGLGIDFTLPTISSYDAIMLGGTYLDATELGVLSSYVDGGGSVYISAGTGNGGPAAEASAWNDFLSDYGIELGGIYTGFIGNVTTAGDQIFDGVSSLYVGNPNSLLAGSICCEEADIFAVWRSGDDGGPGVPPIPLPAGLPLLSVGLIGFGLLKIRRG